jgi:hypothetical protein
VITVKTCGGGGGGSKREEIIIMGRKGHAGYSICSHHLVKDTGEKGRYGPTTRMKHRKSSTPAMWRKSTIKVSPCDICASNDAAVRAKHWRAKGRSFSPWELLEACKKVIGSYDRRAAPGETPDAYADVFLPLYNVVHPYDIIFVKQVLLPYDDPSSLSLQVLQCGSSHTKKHQLMTYICEVNFVVSSITM